MGVFQNCSVLFELKKVPSKKKTRLKLAVTEHGGTICFVVNQQCTLVVTSDVAHLSRARLRGIQVHGVPVVGPQYVSSCVEEGALLPVDPFRLDTSPLPVTCQRWQPITARVSDIIRQSGAEVPGGPVGSLDPACPVKITHYPLVLGKFRRFAESDCDAPAFPENFQVAKYSIFEEVPGGSWSVLELQSCSGPVGQQYRVVRYRKEGVGGAVRDTLVFPSTSEDALSVYQDLRLSLMASGLKPRHAVPPQVQDQDRDLGSAALQQLLLEDKLDAGGLSDGEVGVFVELLWTEALGHLGNVLAVPIQQLSLSDVSRAEGLLLQVRAKMMAEDGVEGLDLLDQFYSLMPHRKKETPSAWVITTKLDLCQLIRDVLNVSEMNLRSPAPRSLGKYRALRCNMETVPHGGSEFQSVASLTRNSELHILRILRVSRLVELRTFRSDLGNVETLLHASAPQNFVGILSRGLLPAHVGQEVYGVQRRDVGKLGSGIYLGRDVRAAVSYSTAGVTDGSRLLLVCDVALGRCKEVHRKDESLRGAPEGHHSVHGVQSSRQARTDFEFDEFVVYSPDQVRLKYVIQFSLPEDKLKDFSPDVSVEPDPSPPPIVLALSDSDSGLTDTWDPLKDVKSGLLDRSGQQLPLQAVHVKCKLMDLLSQVIIFQKYTNQSSVPIEAKYVFPLDDSAAVCGFEAFINGKHVVGQVKEKEAARREYRRAVEVGHGAYLMDQDAPDVFTITVGNLPPGATVIIKVSFVSELIVRDGCVLFNLPGSVAPWQQSAALNQTTQVTMEKVCVTDVSAGQREFSLDMSVEMPFEIRSLQCSTHKIRIKRTDCKAVLSVLPAQVLGPDGFQLSVTLSEAHLPRMWVENHPDKDSQACMLVFYPQFQVRSEVHEVILLLDSSESMKDESLLAARRIALHVVQNLQDRVRVNVVCFGTGHSEALVMSQPLMGVRQEVEIFIKSCSAGGSTELWRPLRALSLLPPSAGVRNLLLLSDGHLHNAQVTLQLLRANVQHSRLFTCGLSSTANRHMLRALAQAGGGAYEYFDPKTKHTWAEKVVRQVKRMASPGCSSVSVKWQQFSSDAAAPLQAPKQLQALFNDVHTLVYGLVPHCTQATLLGNLSGEQLETMVSTTDLQTTTGTFLHKLTARAVIRDYEDGNLDPNEAEHEAQKAALRSSVVRLSTEFSVLSQFTSFVAVEDRDSEPAEDGRTDIDQLLAQEDVDFLPYISWTSTEEKKMEQIKKKTTWSKNSAIVRKSLDLELEDMWETMEEEEDRSATSWGLLESSDSMIYGAISLSPPMTHHSDSCNYSVALLEKEEWVDSQKEGSCDQYDIMEEEDEEEEDDKDAWDIMEDNLIRQSIGCIMAFDGSMDMNEEPQCAAQHHRAPPPPVPADRAALPTPLPPPPVYAYRAAPPPPVFAESAPPLCPHLSPVVSQFASPRLGCNSSSSLSQSLSHPSPVPRLSAEPPPPHPISTGPFSSPFKGLYPDFNSPPSAPPGDAPTPSLGFGGTFGLGGGSLLMKTRYLKAQAAPTSFPLSLSSVSSEPPCSSESGGGSARSFGFVGGSARSSESGGGSARSFGFVGGSARSSESGGGSAHSFGFGGGFPGSFGSSGGALFGASEVSSGSSSFVAFGRQQAHSMSELHVRPEEPMEHLDHFLKQSCSRGLQQITSAPPLPEPAVQRRARAPCRRKICGLSWSSQRLTNKVSTAEPEPELAELKWTKIFQMQNQDGYWELTAELGRLINFNTQVFTDDFLLKKGILSLGRTAHTAILRLLATLLVLQLLRVERVEEGRLLRSLFSLQQPSDPRPPRWEAVRRAVDWVRRADQQYPCICTRLEFGQSWESSTRQLLGFEGLPPHSPLCGLNLQGAPRTLTVH